LDWKKCTESGDGEERKVVAAGKHLSKLKAVTPRLCGAELSKWKEPWPDKKKRVLERVPRRAQNHQWKNAVRDGDRGCEDEEMRNGT
jgi:hypothetical protein